MPRRFRRPAMKSSAASTWSAVVSKAGTAKSACETSKRDLGAAEDHAVGALPERPPRRSRDSAPSRPARCAPAEFLIDDAVDVVALRGIGDHRLDTEGREAVAVEILLHGEARRQQQRPPRRARADRLRGHIGQVQERHLRRRGDAVRQLVHRVRAEQDAAGPRPLQPARAVGQDAARRIPVVPSPASRRSARNPANAA